MNNYEARANFQVPLESPLLMVHPELEPIWFVWTNTELTFIVSLLLVLKRTLFIHDGSWTSRRSTGNTYSNHILFSFIRNPLLCQTWAAHQEYCIPFCFIITNADLRTTIGAMDWQSIQNLSLWIRRQSFLIVSKKLCGSSFPMCARCLNKAI